VGAGAGWSRTSSHAPHGQISVLRGKTFILVFEIFIRTCPKIQAKFSGLVVRKHSPQTGETGAGARGKAALAS
jgi:hypothetical protein